MQCRMLCRTWQCATWSHVCVPLLAFVSIPDRRQRNGYRSRGNFSLIVSTRVTRENEGKSHESNGKDMHFDQVLNEVMAVSSLGA